MNAENTILFLFHNACNIYEMYFEFTNLCPNTPFEHCCFFSLNATHFLEVLRGKNLVFVGDSLNRNMWESLVCILRQSVSDKKKVYEISGRTEFKKKGFYAFRFEAGFLWMFVYLFSPLSKVLNTCLSFLQRFQLIFQFCCICRTIIVPLILLVLHS